MLRVDGRGTLQHRLEQGQGQGQGQSRGVAEEGDEETARGVRSHFWQCNAGSSREGKTCGLFRPLDFRKEGRGRWFVPPARTTEEGGEGGAEPS